MQTTARDSLIRPLTCRWQPGEIEAGVSKVSTNLEAPAVGIAAPPFLQAVMQLGGQRRADRSRWRQSVEVRLRVIKNGLGPRFGYYTYVIRRDHLPPNETVDAETVGLRASWRCCIVRCGF